jgi:hypothetical protein
MTVTVDPAGTVTVADAVESSPSTTVVAPYFKETSSVTVTREIVREYAIPEMRTDSNVLFKMRVLWDVAHHPGDDAELVAQRLGLDVMAVAEVMDGLAAIGVLSLA